MTQAADEYDRLNGDERDRLIDNAAGARGSLSARTAEALREKRRQRQIGESEREERERAIQQALARRTEAQRAECPAAIRLVQASLRQQDWMAECTAASARGEAHTELLIYCPPPAPFSELGRWEFCGDTREQFQAAINAEMRAVSDELKVSFIYPGPVSQLGVVVGWSRYNRDDCSGYFVRALKELCGCGD